MSIVSESFATGCVISNLASQYSISKQSIYYQSKKFTANKNQCRVYHPRILASQNCQLLISNTYFRKTCQFSAKCLAVKRVTSSSGSKTPVVDGVVWRIDHQKTHAIFDFRRCGYTPKPLRRIYIPKKTWTQETQAYVYSHRHAL